jgi:hypothetical protein
MSNIENGGLVYEENTSKNVYVEIKPDGLLVRRINGELADVILQKHNNNQPIDKGYRVRKLEMGENQGKEIVEQIFNKLPRVQLKKAYEEEKFNQRRMVLVFNDMVDGPDVHITCPLITENGGMNSFSNNFIDKIPNFELGSVLNFRPWKNEDEKNNKIRKGIVIEQNGSNLKTAYWDYDKNEPIGNKPRAIEVKKLGKDTWDWEEVSEFQLQIFNDFSVKLDEYWGNEKPLATTKTKEVQVEDMPF